MEPRSIYYAHPMSWYGTDNEKADLQEIRTRFPGVEVVNPSAAIHGDQASRMYAKGYSSREVMGYFIDLVAEADALVYRPFSDGKIGAGVAQEILTAHIHGKEIFMLHSGCSARVCGAPKIMRATSGDLIWDTLTIDETRARIKGGEL